MQAISREDENLRMALGWGIMNFPEGIPDDPGDLLGCLKGALLLDVATRMLFVASCSQVLNNVNNSTSWPSDALLANLLSDHWRNVCADIASFYRGERSLIEGDPTMFETIRAAALEIARWAKEDAPNLSIGFPRSIFLDRLLEIEDQ